MPIFSYLILGGKCRNCKKKISPLYPIVETSTAVVLLLLFLNTSTITYSILFNAFIVLLFTLIIFIDARFLVIPDKILVLLAIAIVGLKFLNNGEFFWLLISAFGLTAFFAILFLVSKGKWIGLGDVKLVFVIGLLLGYPMGYLAIVTAVWLATIFSMVLLIAKKADAKTEIPFGSFLSVATIIFIIFNNEFQEISKYFY